MKTKKKSLFAWFGRTVAVGLVPLMLFGCASDSNNDDTDKIVNNDPPLFSTDPSEGDVVTGTSIIKVSFNEAVTGVSLSNVLLKDAAGAPVAMTHVAPTSGNTYSFDPTDMVSGTYYLRVGEGADIIDSDGQATLPQTIVFSVNDARYTAYKAMVDAGVSAAAYGAADVAAAKVTNSLLSVIPAAMDAGIANATSSADKMLVIGSLIGAANGAASLTSTADRTVTRISDTAGFNTLLQRISQVLVAQSITGKLLPAELETAIAKVNASYTAAGADSDQLTALTSYFNAEISSDVSAESTLTGDYSTAVTNAIGTNTGTTSTFTLTAGTDLADTTTASSGGIQKSFNFTAGNDGISGPVGTLQTADVLLDDTSTDTDVLNAKITGTVAATMGNIESLNLDFAAGTPNFQLTNVTGAKSVSVTGAVAGTLTDLNEDSITLTISDYNKVLTVDLTDLSGTAASSPETLTVNVSGLGTSAGLTISGAATGGTLESLVVNASGTASTLSYVDTAITDTDNITITGSGDVTVAGTHAVLTATLINATANTGSVGLRVDRHGAAATATNFTETDGVDKYIFRDSTVGTDAMVVQGLNSGTTVVIEDDFATGSSITVDGATASTSDSLAIQLDNRATVATDVDVTDLTIDEVETLSIASVEAGTDTASIENSIGTLNADKLTSLTMTGAARLSITMAAEDQGITADGSGMTERLTYNAAAITKSGSVLSNSITGGSAADTLTGSTTEGNTIVGGAGNDTIAITDNAGNVAANLSGGDGDDTITGGRGADTIDAGAGNDTINLTQGIDTVTGGSGNDTFDINAQGVAAVAQVSTLDDASYAAALAANDVIYATINGTTYSQAYTGASADATIAAFVTAHASTILSAHGVTVAAAAGDASDLQFTGASSGATFTITASIYDASGTTTVNTAVTATTAAVAGVDRRLVITDFAAGDVLNLAGFGTFAALSYSEDLTASTTVSANVLVLTDTAGYASADAAETQVALRNTLNDQGVFVFLNSSLGYAQLVYDNDITADGDVAAATATDVDIIVNFTNLTTASGIAAAFSSASFVIQ